MNKIYLVHLSNSTINQWQTVHVVPTHSTPEMTFLNILNLKIQSFKKLQNWKLESTNIMPHGKFHIRPIDKSQLNAIALRQICFHMTYTRFTLNVPGIAFYICKYSNVRKRILKYCGPQASQVRDNQLVCNRLFCSVWRKVKISQYWWKLLSWNKCNKTKHLPIHH